MVRLLCDARAGGSGVLAIVGEAGIDKSALLAYAGPGRYSSSASRAAARAAPSVSTGR